MDQGQHDDTTLPTKLAARILRRRPAEIRRLIEKHELGGWLGRETADGKKYYCTTARYIREYQDKLRAPAEKETEQDRKPTEVMATTVASVQPKTSTLRSSAVWEERRNRRNQRGAS